MTSPFRSTPLRPRAIELLKAGHTPEDVHWQFVNEGADPDEVRAILTELVALLHQAAAMDPKRLRTEATWMFLRGASIDDVVLHFVRVGVAEEHARPEATKILEAVRKMRPCQRCGTPNEPGNLVMDLSGFSICSTCNLRDEIGRSEQRGLARDLEMIGGVTGVGGALVVSVVSDAMHAQANQIGQTRQPFCARCARPSGIHVSNLVATARGRVDPTAQWVCHFCLEKIA
jgi:hypothetical protein